MTDSIHWSDWLGGCDGVFFVAGNLQSRPMANDSL